MRRTRWVAASVAAVALTAACAATPPVAVERSDRTGNSPVVPDGQASLPPIGEPSIPEQETDLPVVAAPASSIVWGSCAPFEIPPAEQLGTSGWECGTLVVEMDPFGESDVGEATVELALTRRMMLDLLGSPIAKRRLNHHHSTRLRAEALLPLHREQVLLLGSWRRARKEGETGEAEHLLGNLLRSVNAIASAMGTTG